MIYRINAGAIPEGTWIQDRDIGGGRIIGEVCHFVDFLTFINGSQPEYVSAAAIPDPSSLQDTLSINISFKNGSIGTILYCANGSKSLSKEYVEIYRAGMTAILHDFRELEIYSSGKPMRKKLVSQDKGQKNMVRSFISSTLNSTTAPISFEEIYAVTMTTFKVVESIRTRSTIKIQ
jgi:predicted dehydrogenase